MKKKLLSLTVLLMGLAGVLASCSKDDDDKVCTCTEYDRYTGESYQVSMPPSNYGVSTCSQLAKELNKYQSDPDFSYSCK